MIACMGVFQIFGYLKPYKDELKGKHVKEYQDAYCTVCYGLRTNLGLFSALLLNYESVFLYLILRASDPEKGDSLADIKCPFNLFGKPKPNECNKNLLEYVSFINYRLVVLKFKDNCRDSKNILFKLIFKLLIKNKKYKKLNDKYHVVSEKMDEQYDNLYHFEKSDDASYDDCSETMGFLLQFVFMYYYTNVASADISQSLFEFGRHLGMWIYLIDAFDDFDKDIKRGKFNPLLLFCAYENQSYTKCLKYGEVMLSLMSHNMVSLLDEVKLYSHFDVVYNIIFSTVFDMKMIIKRRNKKNGKSN